jgi:hypothetical protein
MSLYNPLETGIGQMFRGLPDFDVDVPSIMRQAGYEAGIRAASKILVRMSRYHARLAKTAKNQTLTVTGEEYVNTIAAAFAQAGTEIRKLLK